MKHANHFITVDLYALYGNDVLSMNILFIILLCIFVFYFKFD